MLGMKSNSLRGLQPDKIIETIALLERRIGERFPGSGLRNVANELLQISQESVRRAERIRRPNLLLRGVTFALLACMLSLFFLFGQRMRINSEEILKFDNFVQSLDASLESIVFIGAAVIFIWTLELRLKRNRLVKAIYELRALAHIVDMHQLTKDPERTTARGTATASSPKRTMTLFELGRYLDYCSELLSLISKIGAVYSQDFPDAVALEAVDQLSSLTNGLARNIWQKIMILENMIGPPEEKVLAPSGQPTRGDFASEAPIA
jgi:hypothetical protein